MRELRLDPINNKKIAIATERQDRTFLPPKDYCPLCPTKDKNIPTEIPKSEYDIVVFENRFPTFNKNPNKINSYKNSSIFKSTESKGICEVVSYTSDHDNFLEEQTIEKIVKIIRVWADRYNCLSKEDFVKYVLIFENKGTEIGVTLTHPHCQIYAFSYIPPIPREEIESSYNYFHKNKSCLHCEIIKEEIKGEKRIVAFNDDFIAFIPFYAKFPYEVHLYPVRHAGNLCELKYSEIVSLANLLKELITKYNELFNFRMPYVMVIHQNPTDGKNYEFYHLHFEFYPPYRTQNKLKYLAGCELGAGTFINDSLPEEKAKELRGIKNNNLFV